MSERAVVKSGDEHACYNCKDRQTPSVKEPCCKCLEYRTQYPYWHPAEEKVDVAWWALGQLMRS